MCAIIYEWAVKYSLLWRQMLVQEVINEEREITFCVQLFMNGVCKKFYFQCSILHERPLKNITVFRTHSNLWMGFIKNLDKLSNSWAAFNWLAKKNFILFLIFEIIKSTALWREMPKLWLKMLRFEKNSIENCLSPMTIDKCSARSRSRSRSWQNLNWKACIRDDWKMFNFKSL